MDSTLVLALRMLLVAFAIAGALELIGRVRGKVRQSNGVADDRSGWGWWRRVARVIGLTGVLATVAGVITNAPAQSVVAAMGLAAGGFVLFLLLNVIAAAGRLKD